jgi:hypothetical protein
MSMGRREPEIAVTEQARRSALVGLAPLTAAIQLAVTSLATAPRAWKARPGSPLSRDPTPMVQIRSVCDRPLLTVRTARCRHYGQAEGTAGEDQACSSVAVTVISSTGG